MKKTLKKTVLIKCLCVSMGIGISIAGFASESLTDFTTNEELQQQKRTKVTGKVRDMTGEGVVGATVVEKGTTNASITDVNGTYTLDVSPNALIQVMYVGYKIQTAKVGNTGVLDFQIQEDTKTLSDVVIVGYGTQKKANLTGAVDQVSGEVFENRAITNLSQGLQGQIPNLNINLLDGKPTQSPAFNIRGKTSIGQKGDALVLIDGVEGNPSLLNPNDVESVTVLKDAASASIYGARAVFGVVLITTKTPKEGRFQVVYSTNQTMKKPTTVPNYITDGYIWAQGFSDAYDAWNDYTGGPTKINKTQPFSPEYLLELKKRHDDPSMSKYGIDPITKENIYYGSTDWYDLLYKDQLYAQDHSLSFSGSTDRVSFYLSGKYTHQDGLFRYSSDDYNMYNLRAKANVKITKWLDVTNNTEFSTMNYHNPVNVGEDSGIWRNIADEGHPTSMMFNEDGTLTHSSAYTVGDFWYGKNGRDTNKGIFKNTTSFNANVLDEKINIKGDFTTQQTSKDVKQKMVPVPYSRTNGVVNYIGTNTNNLELSQEKTAYMAANLYATYKTTFNEKHNLKVLVGVNSEQSTQTNLLTKRNGLLFSDANDFNLAFGDDYQINGGYNKWRIFGLFSRVNYSYENRYLVEINARYDGSSKFAEGNQYQLFPSASLAWRLSEEKFFKVPKDIVSNIKFRASYGSLGNGSIDPYKFTQLYDTEKLNRIINGNNPVYFKLPQELPESLTWETATTTNLGLDLGFFKNRLTFTGDVYRRNTINMFTNAVTPPRVYGGKTPKGNYADMSTTGWELSASFRDNFQVASKPFNYNIGLGLSDDKTVITKFNNPDRLLSNNSNNYYVGQTLGEIWGYETMGLFQTEDEIKNAPSQKQIQASNGLNNLPGDIRFADLNGDGEINDGKKTVDDPGDMRIIGNSSPRFRYTINLGADWNNFFFSSMFRGVLKQDWWPGGDSRFWGQYNRPYNDFPTWHQDNMWSETNTNAYLPRLRGYSALGDNRELSVKQTRYLQNAAYIRLQNLQIGYNLPRNLTKKLAAQSIKVYFSGENLWTWSPMYKYTRDTDVTNIGESDKDLTKGDKGNGYNYPTLSSYTLGLSVTF